MKKLKQLEPTESLEAQPSTWEAVLRLARALARQAAREDHEKWLSPRKRPRKRVLKR